MPGHRIHVHTPEGLWPPTWPMGLTMLRMLLLPVFLWAMLVDGSNPEHPRRWLAVSIFIFMAITDKLDGYLARKLHQATKLGAILDPIADKLLIACSVMLLSFDWVAARGFAIPLWVVIAVYGKDVFIAVGALVLVTLIGHIHIQARFLGKLSTVVQLAMVIATLVAPAETNDLYPMWRTLVKTLWWVVTVVAAAATADYLREGVLQLRQARVHPPKDPHTTETAKL